MSFAILFGCYAIAAGIYYGLKRIAEAIAREALTRMEKTDD